jgi:hypothetical protein
MLSTSPSESSAGPNAELVVGRGCEHVMIAHEGASYYGASRLPKIGENGGGSIEDPDVAVTVSSGNPIAIN